MEPLSSFSKLLFYLKWVTIRIRPCGGSGGQAKRGGGSGGQAKRAGGDAQRTGDSEAADGEEDGDDEEVERDAEEVHDDGAVRVGHVARAERANRREVHADARLEAEEGSGERRQRGDSGATGAGGGGAHSEGGEAQHAQRGHLRAHAGLGDGAKGGGAKEAADHEAREDGAVRRRAPREGLADGGGDGRRPLQNENVHGTLEEGLHAADEQNLRVGDGDFRRVADRHATLLVITASSRRRAVLLPSKSSQQRARREEANRELEGSRCATRPRRERRELTRRDGHQRIACVGLAEGVTQRAGRAGTLRLADQPGLGRGEEERGADAAGKPAEQKHPQQRRARRECADCVEEGEGKRARLAPLAVGEATDCGPEERRRAEARQEELRDERERGCLPIEDLRGVHLVEVRPLQPVRHAQQPEDREEAHLQRTRGEALLRGCSSIALWLEQRRDRANAAQGRHGAQRREYSVERSRRRGRERRDRRSDQGAAAQDQWVERERRGRSPRRQAERCRRHAHEKWARNE